MNNQSIVLVCGAGGFIGSHLVTKLKNLGNFVVGVDLKYPEFSKTDADIFIQGDLCDQNFVKSIFNKYSFNEIFQLAEKMGGCEYIFVENNDSDIMLSNMQINSNIASESIKQHQKGITPKIFFSSSACIYPEHNQLDPNNPNCKENTDYPSDPDSEYGWMKLTDERLYLSLLKNHKIPVRIARYHNIFGPNGTYKGGLEKAPAALCRKIALCHENSEIQLYGIKNHLGEINGFQTRSFLFIDECIEGTLKLMNSNFVGPVNIGSDEMISIKDFANLIIKISNKNNIKIKWILGPTGVKGRNSDNNLIKEKLNWAPSAKLEQGIKKTYHWIVTQLNSSN